MRDGIIHPEYDRYPVVRRIIYDWRIRKYVQALLADIGKPMPVDPVPPDEPDDREVPTVGVLTQKALRKHGPMPAWKIASLTETNPVTVVSHLSRNHGKIYEKVGKKGAYIIWGLLDNG